MINKYISEKKRDLQYKSVNENNNEIKKQTKRLQYLP